MDAKSPSLPLHVDISGSVSRAKPGFDLTRRQVNIARPHRGGGSRCIVTSPTKNSITGNVAPPFAESKKYRQVIDFVETAIAEGRYRHGDRLPSESELVRQFGLSRPTISRAMRELKDQGVIERRAGSGSYVRVANQADPPSQLLFGLLIPGLGDTEIFESICGQIAREAHTRGHGLLWADLSSSGPEGINAERICEPYLRQAVSGVFFAPLELSPTMDDVNRKIVTILNQANIPIVLLDRDLEPFPKRSNYDLVGIDNFAAGHELAQHLLACGCKRIIFLARPMSAETVRARSAGVLAALVAAGQTPSNDWSSFTDASDVNQIRAVLKETRCDGIICANDKTAAVLMQTLHELNISVPNDVKVVGIDDVRYARLLRPTLTTIHQPCQEIGTAALQTMLERLTQPNAPTRQILLPTHLIVRQSAS